MKLPSTSGGAAGSLVRGNEFYRDAPAPYSHTRRGQDTIHITPGHIRVTRQPEQKRTLRPELLLALRLTPAQVAVVNTLEGVNPNAVTAPHIRRLHPLVLSRGDGSELRQDWPQDELWQFPGTFQAKGDMVSVGDDYFVLVSAGSTSSAIPTEAVLQLDDKAGARVALIHKDNLDGPYLNTVTRQRAVSGHSLVFHKITKSADRLYNDRRGDLLKDRFGANYFLEEARRLLTREHLVNWAADVEGHTISVVPLGWLDKEHRYAFAVFGHTAQEYSQGQVQCLVYCTGKRALVRRTTIAPPAATPANAAAWAGGLFGGRASPRMAALGRGTMATVLMPRARYTPAGQTLANISINARAAGVPPMLVWSTDFGQTFQKRYMHEIEPVIARAFGANNYFPQGGVYYPELKFHIEAMDEHGNFLLAIAKMNARPSGDVPSAAYDSLFAERLDAGAEGPDYRRWWHPGDANRQSQLTLFRGHLGGGALVHLPGLDALQLRFGHWLDKAVFERGDATVPPGTYRYNVVMNGLLGACTPMLQAYAPGCSALAVRTLEVTIAPGWTSAARDPDVYRTVETFLMVTESSGTLWDKVALPDELVSYRDSRAFGALSDPTAPNGAAADPRLLHMSWCTTIPKKDHRAASVALLVQQPDAAALYTTDRRPAAQNNTWALRKTATLQPEPVHRVADLRDAWDQGECGTPSALAYLGDADSDEYPDHLRPAIPQLFKQNL